MTAHRTAEQILRDIDARNQIHDTLMRYCRGVDRLDRELVLSCYHPGARDNHGGFDGPIEEFVDWAFERHRNVPSCTHFIGNEFVEIDGATAHCETYVIVYQRLMMNGAPHDLTGVGRYIDRFECRNGAWKIADRVCIYDMDRLDPVVGQWDGKLTSALSGGRRDHDDPSYRLLNAGRRVAE